MTTVPMKDIRKCLPVAICNRQASAADCLLPEGGSEGISMEVIPGLLRAALFAIECGAGEIVPPDYESRHLRSAEWAKVRQDTRAVLVDWLGWCSRDPKPSGWRGQVNATKRVITWIDELDRGEVTS